MDKAIQKELEEKYKLLLKAYGEHSEYVAGFRACMQIVESEGEKMKPYEATEIAYKNGYKQGVKDFAERVKELVDLLAINNVQAMVMKREIDRITKELKESKENESRYF